MSTRESEFKTLAEVGHVGRGKSRHRPRNDPDLYGGEFPFIQTGDVKHAPFYLSDYSQTYNERGLAQSKLWPPGTLCITIAANIADTAILTIPACFPDSILGFQPQAEMADVRYVKYCLDGFRGHLEQISKGTTQDNLSLDKLLKLRFWFPDLDRQKKIAAILSTYDDLIANNQRRIALLESMAEEIYREWFVRMRFPGCGTAEFDKGRPRTWAQTTLGAVARFTMGQSPSSEHYNESADGLPFHQGVGTYGSRYPLHTTFCSVPGRMAKAGDILFSVRAPVGRLNIADTDLIIGRGLSAIRHVEGANSYLFYLLRVTFANEDMIGNGSIFNSVGKDELSGFQLLKPPAELVERFEKLVNPIDQELAVLYKQQDHLQATRDALLPRLISGKLRVDQLNIQAPPSMRAETAQAV